MTDLCRASSSLSLSDFEKAVELAALSWFELIGSEDDAGDFLPERPIGARTSYKQPS